MKKSIRIDIDALSDIDLGDLSISAQQLFDIYKRIGVQYYRSMSIEGDSGEYEFLTEAVELSKDVEGICIEIGLRRGLGTKTIIDAVRQYCPNKTVIAVDPYGSIPYVGREHIGEIRLDYDNSMKNDCLADMWAYVRDNPVSFRYECLTDYEYFLQYDTGVPRYELERIVEEWYSMCHLDGPHNYEHVSTEVIWFNDRMKSGAVIVIDDCTPDFIQIEPINELLFSLGWELYKVGVKKNIYMKR